MNMKLQQNIINDIIKQKITPETLVTFVRNTSSNQH